MIENRCENSTENLRAKSKPPLKLCKTGAQCKRRQCAREVLLLPSRLGLDKETSALKFVQLPARVPSACLTRRAPFQNIL